MENRSGDFLKTLLPQIILFGILVALLFFLPGDFRGLWHMLVISALGVNLLLILSHVNVLGGQARRARPEQNSLISRHQELASFARELSEGNLTTSFRAAGDDDEIGKALLSLRSALELSRKEGEALRSEEEQRIWTSRGLARFGSLLNEASDDLSSFSMTLLKELVSYTEADVGALFLKSEKGILDLEGAYAYDREKHVRRSYEFGEGLVGRAAVEKEVILISDLPPDSLKIRSGLGEDFPAALLLVPVILDSEVLGVLELATLGAFPRHQVEFIQQLGSSLASTLAKVKANLRTRKQADELASQEEVFREKLETLERNYAAALEREKAALRELDELRKS